MLATKINITKFLTKEEIDNIFKYSSKLSVCYNLCLEQLKTNNDWSKIHEITKNFQNENTEIYSKHAQNVGRECISAVKSFFKLKKTNKRAKYPKNFREFSPIILDTNKQIRKNKVYFGGGFKFVSSNVLKFTYPEINILDLSNCQYFISKNINIDTLKQIVLKIEDKQVYCIFIYSEPKKEKTFNKEFISIDLGISSIASIYSSKGECFKIKTKRFKGLEKNKDKIKAKRDKFKKYSRKYKKIQNTLIKKQKRLTNKRKDYLHKTSKKIINYCIENKIDNIICRRYSNKKINNKI